MSGAIITVEGLGKRYRIGTRGAAYFTLGDSLAGAAGRLAGLLRGVRAPRAEDLWALRDVSFQVQPGEVVGIIGRNGAGKSTLLKILSRITEPTEGRATLRGRVGSLLEVGTGFHGELSGRENIYLSGAILGMSKVEIDRKFDEIVAFSGVEQFLDTPIKHYSSGMNVRLGFAVAAHLEPEILLVDEVLAVGDAEFQKKCLGKMGEVARGGRTVLFVSHNMGAVRQLCSRGVLLDKGCLASVGSPDEVIQRHLDRGPVSFAEAVFPSRGDVAAWLRRTAVVNTSGAVVSEVDVRRPFWIVAEFVVTKPVRNLEVSVRIRTARGAAVCMASLSDAQEGSLVSLEPGRFACSFEVPALFLVPDAYRLSLELHHPNVQTIDYREDALQFSVSEAGSSMRCYPHAWVNGPVLSHFATRFEHLGGGPS